MLAREKMTRRVHSVHPTEEARAAYAKMIEFGVRHLPVLENGQLMGILSDRDFLLHAKPGRSYEYPEGLRVNDIMTRDVVTATKETPLSEIANRMIRDQIDCLPILGAGAKLAGIVTSTDLLRILVERDPESLNVEHTNEFMHRFAWDLPESAI